MEYVRLLFTVLWLACMIRTSCAKSCHYNNLHATFGWTLVKSPGYPGRFPAQTQCWWKISAPPDYKIQLEFTDFSLVKADKQNRCVWQWLNVIEGASDPEDSVAPMLTLCGTNRPRLIISSGNALRINLHSNAAAANALYRGFSARYKYTKEDAYMPTQLSSLMPDNAGAGGASASPGVPSEGVSRSLGSVIGPLARPKPLPPNPNAVLTLQNRRTESRNRVRNSGTAAENNMRNNDPPFPSTPRRPPGYRQHGIQVPRPMNPLDNNFEKQELPTRTKPLRREYKILLAVMGTIAAVALIAFLVKKFVFDKVHKRKPGEGKLMHAYAHFRHFKKKRNDDPEASKVNTISASIASANGTLKSKDSGLSTSPDSHDAEDNKPNVSNVTQNRSKTMQPQRNLPDLVMEHQIPRNKSAIGKPDSFEERGARCTGQHRSGPNDGEFQTTNSMNRCTIVADAHPPSDIEETERPRRERQRRRRRRRGDVDMRHKSASSNRRHPVTTNRNVPLKSQRSTAAHPRHARHQRRGSSSSDYSGNGGRHAPSWRDRAYS